MCDELPELLSMIAAEIGENVALKIVEAYGGSNIYIPMWGGDYPVHAELITMFGREVAQRIVQLLAPGSVYIPTCSGLLRKRKIRDSLKQGLSARDVARAHGITERTVRRVTNMGKGI